MDLKYLAEQEAFAVDPAILTFLKSIQAAFDEFHHESDQCDRLSPDEGRAALLNALIRLRICLEVAVNIRNGMEPVPAKRKARRAIKRMLVATWSVREISIAERRAIAVAIAYREGLRFSVSGERDSRMQAAHQVVAILEGRGGDAGETVRKSITRLRAKVRGKSLFRLNTNALRIEVVNADSVMLAGLSGKAGRRQRVIECVSRMSRFLRGYPN